MKLALQRPSASGLQSRNGGMTSGLEVESSGFSTFPRKATPVIYGPTITSPWFWTFTANHGVSDAFISTTTHISVHGFFDVAFLLAVPAAPTFS